MPVPDPIPEPRKQPIDPLDYFVLKATLDELVWCERQLQRYPSGLLEGLIDYFNDLEVPHDDNDLLKNCSDTTLAREGGSMPRSRKVCPLCRRPRSGDGKGDGVGSSGR